MMAKCTAIRAQANGKPGAAGWVLRKVSATYQSLFAGSQHLAVLSNRQPSGKTYINPSPHLRAPRVNPLSRSYG